jgi:DNA-binding NtrC family response regulator
MHNELPTDLLRYTSHRIDSPEPSRKTILLVDDDPDIRSLTRTFLDHEGYRVHSCGDTQRAKQIFSNAVGSSAHIDLVITDLYMPDQSGMELALELKSQHREIPVLLISGGFVGAEHREQLREEGWHFLSKPFGLPDLLTAVHLILGSSEATV